LTEYSKLFGLKTYTINKLHRQGVGAAVANCERGMGATGGLEPLG